MHKNPIIPGFNPDPSICSARGKFYVTTSSFQWWPGLPIYESCDLRHWRLIDHALKNMHWPDLRRIGDSAGVWAPSLTYAEGLFWLVFPVASGSRQHNYESRNYLTWASSIHGPWADPVFLNASGNDPSLFHDDDGRKWVVNTCQNKLGEGVGHQGILLQEYDPKKCRLIGKPVNIFPGTDLGIPEGAKLHKHGSYYYLLMAEGGTEYGHAMTVARAAQIEGPYVPHPDNPVLTARNDPANRIQRAGHPDLVTLAEDSVAIVYLASRPIGKRSHLGRETYLALGRWSSDGWLRLDSRTPQADVPDFRLPLVSWPAEPSREDFSNGQLRLGWYGLRGPFDDFVDLRSRPGWLILEPRHSFFDSLEQPSILARRVAHHVYTVTTRLEFEPLEEQQLAGLICYYDSRRFFALCKIRSGEGESAIILIEKNSRHDVVHRGRVHIPSGGAVDLRVDCDGRGYRFACLPAGRNTWLPVGDTCDALILSDEEAEYRDPIKTYGFTGSFVGLAAYNVQAGGPKPAFDWFEYAPGKDFWSDDSLR